MVLATGSRLGAYEVTAHAGSGGMGEVYRARDLKLGREVAIKVLPESVEQDAERIARFEREARALAALNHPHIATLFGMERHDGRHFLVMELVEGETLAELLERTAIASGPAGSHRGLPLDQALAIALQIADALEAAHERGIVHRDLKPANVKVTPDDVVKVLDFGLAKAMEQAPGSTPQLTQSPTLSVMATGAGVILGTAAYMSPEQAKGQPTDHRSDVFSFGGVLFELITGRMAFPGDSVTDVLASVLAREPDWTALPPAIDARVTTLLKRCLAKSRRQRWQAIGDVRAEIEIIIAAPAAAPAPVPAAAPVQRAPLWRRAVPIVAAALVAAALGGLAAWRLRPIEPRPITRFSFVYPSGMQSGNLSRNLVAVAPDGSHLVFTTQRGLSIRSMASGEVRPLVDGRALIPVFSPDGRSIAFSLERVLHRIGIAGGVATPLLAPQMNGAPMGMSWGTDGIVYSTGEKILRIQPSGGAAETLVELQDGVASQPQVLPGGRAVMFTYAADEGVTGWERAQVVVQPLPSGERRVVVQGGTHATYLPSGHLLYIANGIIMAARFDPERGQLAGDSVPMVEGVLRSIVAGGLTHYSVGDDGTLAYVPGPVTTRAGQWSLTVTELSGAVRPIDLRPAAYTTPRYSPDGKSIAFGINDEVAAVWIHDLSGASAPRRLTFEGRNRSPVWSRDGQRVAYWSQRDSGRGIYARRADGSGAEEQVTTADANTIHLPEVVTPNGRALFYSAIAGDRVELWSVAWPGGNPTRVEGIASASPISAALSPDGRWLAYATRGTSGLTTLFLSPYPPTGAKYQVSKNDEDAHHPVWSPDGTRLYYVPAPGSLLAVAMTARPTPVFGESAAVPRGFAVGNAPNDPRGHDLSPDGQGFVGVSLVTGPGTVASTIEVVRNWFEELKERVPVR